MQLGEVVDVAAGFAHTCVIASARRWSNVTSDAGDDNGWRQDRLLCWGARRTTRQQTIVPGEAVEAAAVACGGFHTCAIAKESRMLVCWGWNNNGQVDVPLGLGRVALVAAGGYHTCAYTESGQLRCWGGNDLRQASAPTIGRVTALAAGHAHTCAVSSQVVCWGDDSHGQSTVPLLTEVSKISAGFRHTCAIASTVRCWGAGLGGDYGQARVPEALQLGKVCEEAEAEIVIETGSSAAIVVVAVGVPICIFLLLVMLWILRRRRGRLEPIQPKAESTSILNDDDTPANSSCGRAEVPHPVRPATPDFLPPALPQISQPEYEERMGGAFMKAVKQGTGPSAALPQRPLALPGRHSAGKHRGGGVGL
mmetsp:Transcript_2712/g.6376  ORF Transcript_2712/g.6376 Transcript_2712/m.6376 type:complete len:366 (-) Transcript_2712:334-1431(-)